MKRKLFVGGLSWNTTEDNLRAAFTQFGELEEVKVVTHRDTGRSKGFGFVTFNDAEQAKVALEKMNGTELDGRTIRVNEAHDRKKRLPRRDDRDQRWEDDDTVSEDTGAADDAEEFE